MKERRFKPFDKILVKKKREGAVWRPEIFAGYDASGFMICGLTIMRPEDWDVIPYEGNEHLYNSDIEFEEDIKLEEGEFIICNHDIDILEKGHGFMTQFCYAVDDLIYTGSKRNLANDEWAFCIRLSDFDVKGSNIKNILYARNGKIYRWKEQ